MKSINKYIQIDICQEDEVFETNCLVKQDGSHVYLTYSLLDNECLFDFSKATNTIVIKIDQQYFEKYDQTFNLTVGKQNICCNTQSRLQELLNCKLTGVVRNVFLESIVLYLLFQIQKNNLVFNISCDSCSFLNKPMEMDKIQKARDYIVGNLDQNITIPIIANHVGTNQCYLKKGFKEVTGQTIFEFLQENRMVKARYYLQNTVKTIQEVSGMVGYASISSFSQTYKNYYGLSPSLEQKQFGQ
jgi:AraC-like DNA-binding protein